ncbi:MAG: 50S ribosomal protein L20 [Flavobacteriales bacterium]|nr:50S ribosomal protein L20 [Flavobacteriales bacterium]
MPRSVNHVASRARRKRILKFAKGYWGRRKNVWTVAKNAVEKGWTYAYRDRKTKKRNFRGLWIQRINAATRMHDLSYSKFMSMVHNSGLELNRKVLADLAMNHPDAFKAVLDHVKENGEKKTVKAKPVKAAPKAVKTATKATTKKESTAVAEETQAEVKVDEKKLASDEEAD